MRIGFEIAAAVAFVVSVLAMSTTALPIGLILIGLIAWPDARPRESERDRQEARVDAALEALRGLGRDYPRSN
jgi:hypothetical protein